MAFSDTDLIKQLQMEQKTLITRLVSIRHAIVGLGGEVSNRELQELLDADGEPPISRTTIVPEQFSPDLPRTKKIAYALKELGGHGNVSEITEKIMELEPELKELDENDKAKFRRNVMLLTAYLYRDGRLAVKRDDKNKNRYRLVE